MNLQREMNSFLQALTIGRMKAWTWQVAARMG